MANTTRALFLRLGIGCILPILLLPAWASVNASFLRSPCNSVGLCGCANWISCAGSCDSGDCQSWWGQDNKGVYRYCKCIGGDESSCCHLVARSQTELGVRGTCNYPDCDNQTGHTCQLITEQAVCATPPPQ